MKSCRYLRQPLHWEIYSHFCVSFIFIEYPISLVDMGFFHIWKEGFTIKITIEHLEFPLSVKDKITKIPKIIAVCGNIGSGKTTYIENY